MSNRSSDHLRVVATGVQNAFGRDRRRSQLDDSSPPLAVWRCNLTALSQLHNLYFVACGKDIHVYVPRFPSQAISERPSLILVSEPTTRGATGYLDPQNPHYINYMITQILGNEEVVAVVRDSGDVHTFLVRHVVQALARRAEPGNLLGEVANELRPFFQTNVGASAWGLAIHSQARILATSSNAHEIRIFKFGLLHESDDASFANPDVSEEEDSDDHPADLNRATDVTHQVLNGESNIPHISFCNTGDDPHARWLLTTDISGICRVMDLHAPQPQAVQKFRFGRGFLSPHSGGFDRFNAGWIISFLNKRSFRQEQSVQGALGLFDDEILPGLKSNSSVWDIGQTIDHFPGASQDFVRHRSDIAERRSRQPSGRSSPGNATDSSPAQAQLLSDTINPADVADWSDSDMENEEGGVTLPIEFREPEEPDESEQSSDDDRDDLYESDELMTDVDATEDDEVRALEYMSVVNGDLDPDDEGTEDSTPFTAFYNGNSVRGNEPLFASESLNLCEDLHCPIFHSTLRNVYLIQPSDQTMKPSAYMPPMVGIANPLRQNLQENYDFLRLFERLNMYAEITPLGIIVIASQKGRAMLLSLTSTSKSASYPKELKHLSNKTNYGMRVECILPFAEQETANKRPFAPLHGIAVSPLQGSRTSRWRLLMMYQDHTILSYEIARKASAESVGLNVEQLIT